MVVENCPESPESVDKNRCSPPQERFSLGTTRRLLDAGGQGRPSHSGGSDGAFPLALHGRSFKPLTEIVSLT